MLRGVLTKWSINLFTTNVKQFILAAHTHSMSICVPIPDYKAEVKRLDTVEDVLWPGSMSRTKVTTDRLKVVFVERLKNLISATMVPEGVEDFLGANVPAHTSVQQRVL